MMNATFANLEQAMEWATSQPLACFKEDAQCANCSYYLDVGHGAGLCQRLEYNTQRGRRHVVVYDEMAACYFWSAAK